MRALPELLKEAEEIHRLYHEADKLKCSCYNDPDRSCQWCSKVSNADNKLKAFCQEISAGLAEVSITPD